MASKINKNDLNESSNLTFKRFISAIDVSFWSLLREKKLSDLKLSTDIISIKGQYSLLNKFQTKSNNVSSVLETPMFFSINEKAFEVQKDKESTQNKIIQKKLSYFCSLYGTLVIYNKKSELFELDYKKVAKDIGTKIYYDMKYKKCLKEPWRFNTFHISCYSDLKSYKFYYWLLFPVLNFPLKLLSYLQHPSATEKTSEIRSQFSDPEINRIFDYVLNQSVENPSFGGFFLIKTHGTLQDSFVRNLEFAYLSEWDSFFPDSEQESLHSNVYLSFLDPSTHPNTPGWPLRNVLFYAARIAKLKKINVLCIRKPSNFKDLAEHSIILDILLPEIQYITDEVLLKDLSVIGWEKNEQDKLGLRYLDLSKSMDPNIRAKDSVDLNLKLMRWRAEPRINLDIVANTKCLILGAGTLGCHVARGLLAWNVKIITLVDNGKVSYSNPVRQPLYKFEDCINGGKPKAETAAIRLKEIYPYVEAKGYGLTIPMPGHSLSSSEIDNTKKDIELIEKLIAEHDVIFMLTDSRESRWLPTILASKHNKLLINVALGFDSYMVMRHGVRKEANFQSDNLPNMSCYFCQDVVAPIDSLTDRTMDEQCTVTRPGVAALGGANAVELMVSILQHPLGALADPPFIYKSDGSKMQAIESEEENDLNRLAQKIPHQLRGFLHKYEQVLPTGQAYPQCTACSNYVIEAYQNGGFEFLKSVFNDSSTLTKVTGLDVLLQGVDQLDMFEEEFSDDSDFETVNM